MEHRFDTMQQPEAADAVAPETVPLGPGTCLSIPAGTHFQFRADAGGPLTAVGVTMPPWPGDNEAYEVPGAWPADGSA